MSSKRIDRRSLIAGALAAPSLALVFTTQAADETPWIILAGNDTGPMGRWGHSLIPDLGNGRLLVIGGRDDKGTVRGDLWAFDLAGFTWSELDLSGPKARSGSAAAVAADGSGFYYFGGESDDETFSDLWWFDFANTSWQPIDPASGPLPAARSETRGAIDAFGRFVISHGCDGDKLFDDTWAFDPTARTWTDISPPVELRPLARCAHDLISLPDYGLLLLTGGCSEGIGPCPQGDLWAFDAGSQTWSDITPPNGPAPRTGAAMARMGTTVLLVGGLTDLGMMSDVWEGTFQDGYFSWVELTNVNHGPMGIYRRFGHDMNAAGNEFYVFGGEGVEGPLSDLWQFSLDRMAQSEDEGEQIEPA